MARGKTHLLVKSSACMDPVKTGEASVNIQFRCGIKRRVETTSIYDVYLDCLRHNPGTTDVRTGDALAEADDEVGEGKGKSSQGHFKGHATKTVSPLFIFWREIVLLWILIAFNLLCVTDCEFIKWPRNVAVVKGEKAIMSCATNLRNRLEWSAMDPHARSIYDGYDVKREFSQYYEVNNSVNGQFDLNVKKSERDTALRYICSETETDVRSAELIVLESEPSCSETQFNELNKSDILTITCRVKFAGNWPPAMMWMSKNLDYTAKAEDQTIPNTMVMVALNLSRQDIDQYQNFTCITKFSNDNYGGEATTKEPPVYHHECRVEVKGIPKEEPEIPRPVIVVIVVIVVAICGIVIAIVIIKVKKGPRKDEERHKESSLIHVPA